MSDDADLPVPAEAIEAAAKAMAPLHKSRNLTKMAEVAIRAADKARGMEVEEHENPWNDSDDEGWRLVSRWFQVKP